MTYQREAIREAIETWMGIERALENIAERLGSLGIRDVAAALDELGGLLTTHELVITPRATAEGEETLERWLDPTKRYDIPPLNEILLRGLVEFRVRLEPRGEGK